VENGLNRRTSKRIVFPPGHHGWADFLCLMQEEKFPLAKTALFCDVARLN